MTQTWPSVIFYNMIHDSAINAFIIWQGINHENGNICMKQRRKFLINLGNEFCGITEEEQPVPPISATRKINVTLAENGALFNKRARSTLCDRKKDQKCQSLCYRCGKLVCPKHSDIVCISCAQCDLTITTFILYIFVCVYLQVFLRLVLLFLFI